MYRKKLQKQKQGKSILKHSYLWTGNTKEQVGIISSMFVNASKASIFHILNL